MQKISNVIMNVIGSCSESSTFLLSVALSNSWREIVGSDLHDVSSLKNIKYTGPNKITVYINVISAASSLIKYNEENIKEKIEKHSKISDVSIIFKHCNTIYNIQKNKPAEKKDTIKIAHKIDENFKNDSLKSALELLKTEMQNAA